MLGYGFILPCAYLGLYWLPGGLYAVYKQSRFRDGLHWVVLAVGLLYGEALGVYCEIARGTAPQKIGAVHLRLDSALLSLPRIAIKIVDVLSDKF